MAPSPPPHAPDRLHSGAPFWLVKHGEPPDGRALDEDASCDVAVIGAGMTGAFLADTLSAQGLRVIVLDRHAAASGSTGASTALVMYDLDVDLGDLMRSHGEEDALRIYRLSLQSASVLAQTALGLGGCGLSMRESLCLASRPASTARLRKEAALRVQHGFPSSFLDADAVAKRYGVRSHGALLSGAGGQVDPMRLTLALLQRAVRRGARLCTHTDVTHIERTDRGVRLHTARARSVRARHVVHATGYELPPNMPTELVAMRSTFALATERMARPPEWLERTILWETARPYAYLRSSGDGHLLIGGEDTHFRSASLRDQLLPSRTARLESRLARLVPGAPRTAFTWAGTFAETVDCLPLIGPHPREPRAFVALAYGGNGMTFSVLAARLIADALLERPNASARLFAPDREIRAGATPSCGASRAAGESTSSRTTGAPT